MRSKITVTGANIVFFIFAVLFLLSQFILTIFISTSVIINGPEYANNFLQENIYPITFINEYLFILTPVIIYALIKKLNFKEVFRLKSPGLIPAFLIILMSVPAYFVALSLNSIVIYLLQFIGPIPAQPIPVPRNLQELVIGIFFIAVTPGICEEMLHRGLLLKAYEKRGTIKALIITSIFFGIFHFDINNLLGPIFLGLLIGYYVIRTNSIFAGMIAHFLNNAFAEIMQYFYARDLQIETVRISGLDLLSAITYGIIGFLVLSVFIVLFRKVTEKRCSYMPPISSIKEDVISVISHWPIIIIVLLYVVMVVLSLITLSVNA